AHLHLDPALLDFPVAHRTLLRLHERSSETEWNAVAAATLAADSREDTIARREKSGFQILAHFGQGAAGDLAHVGGGAAELAAEGVGEVAVAGKAQVEGQRGEVAGAAGQSVERSAEAQLGEVAMDRKAGSLAKEAGEMKGGGLDGP